MKGPLSFSGRPRFLLVRPDKIGDVVLTLPALASLRKKYPEAYIGFLCRAYAAPVLQKNPAINLIIKAEELPFPGLMAYIREHRFDVSVHFYLDNRCVLAALMAGVPQRVGPLSKPAALFLNHRLKQNRSRVEKHEAEYNWDLVRYCGAEAPPEAAAIFLTEFEKKSGKDFLSALLKNPEKKPFLIHPGSAGSVQNWPASHFFELAVKIADHLGEVVVTAGKGEEWVTEKAAALAHPNVHAIPAGQLSLRELMSVIAHGKTMISNSTGPLHIACALGVPTLSFYPRLPLVTSAKRWGPFGNSNSNRILSPHGENDPMASLSPQTAFETLKRKFA